MEAAFTLEPRRWFAMECLFPNGSRHFSPIWIDRVQPAKTGAGILDIEFYHANYAEGVRNKGYRLKILHRAAGYLMARRETEDVPMSGRMTLLLEPISVAWLRTHFPSLGIDERDAADLATRLDRETARVPSAVS